MSVIVQHVSVIRRIFPILCHNCLFGKRSFFTVQGCVVFYDHGMDYTGLDLECKNLKNDPQKVYIAHRDQRFSAEALDGLSMSARILQALFY